LQWEKWQIDTDEGIAAYPGRISLTTSAWLISFSTNETF
jgi:hypothetical protein